MKRKIIKINSELCNGCGICVDGCHEGALQLINGKAHLISELYCDGLGACIGECPTGAIEIEEREAEEYDEVKVIDRMIEKGEAVLKAHLKHLIEHHQIEYVKQGVQRLKEKGINIDLNDLVKEHHSHYGCPGSQLRTFKVNQTAETNNHEIASQLTHWPIQMHLINPSLVIFENKDLLLSADCVAFSMGNFHNRLLRGKMLAVACPKLDSNKEVYIEKLVTLIEKTKINTITIAIMEVPCCNGLLQMVQIAQSKTTRKVPVKLVRVSLNGEIINDEWI